MMYTIRECAKLGLFVLVLLSTIIFFLEGCITSQIRVIHDEIPCIMSETTVSLFGQNRLYETATVDCSMWSDEADEEQMEKVQADAAARKKKEEAIAWPLKKGGE